MFLPRLKGYITTETYPKYALEFRDITHMATESSQCYGQCMAALKADICVHFWRGNLQQLA